MNQPILTIRLIGSSKNVENNNGKVGTYGISLSGAFTLRLARLILIRLWKRVRRKHLFPIGFAMIHTTMDFVSSKTIHSFNFGQFRPNPTSEFNYLKPFKFETQDGYNYYLRLGGFKETTDNYEKQIGSRIKFWDEMMAHPNYDQWWKDRNILPKLKNIGCATMTVGGWYDNEDLYGALKNFTNISKTKSENSYFNVLVSWPLVSRRLGTQRRRLVSAQLISMKNFAFIIVKKIELPF